MLTLLCTWAFAQPDYQLTVGSETYTQAPNPTTVSMPEWDDAPIEYQQIGFDFPFYGTTYTQFHIDPNGNIYFTGNAFETVIDPFGADLTDLPGDNDTALILTQTLGTAGNQVKVIEWRNARFKTGAATDVANFQIRLFEDGRIAFVYGNIVASAGAFGSGTGPFCGAWDDVSGKYLFLHEDPAAPTLKRTFSLPFPQLDGVPAENTRYGFGISTSIPQYTGPADLRIYPNPTASRLNVEVSEAQALEVFATNGQKQHLPMERSGTEWTLDVSGLAEGVYLIRVYSAEGIRNTRFTVKY